MIPKIIHQTWKTEGVPRSFGFFQQSWQRHHPDWEYCLWTDRDNREFIARHYPWFLPIFDGYATPICRVDAVRYFLLRHYGGVYADLDFECLRPLDDLLEGREAVLGLEPDRHMDWHHEKMAEHAALACNAWMASRPGHPFWDHVIDWLVREHRRPGPLDATGPFLLTRALESYRGEAPVAVQPSEILYPLDSTETATGRAFDLSIWVERTAAAYAVHHWANTWVGGPSGKTLAQIEQPALPVRDLPVRVHESGRRLFSGEVHLPDARECPDAGPLVSCLMVTRDREIQALGAVKAFRAQSWRNRELVILDESKGAGLADAVAAMGDASIRHICIPSEGKSLGTLRNEAIAQARGEYICQWDDDDLYDPARIELQMEALLRTGAVACMLYRWTIWWPEEERLASSASRPWEGSLLCERARVPRYPDLCKGEDTPVAEALMRAQRVVLLDLPRLYVYVAHCGNTFSEAHFDAQWEAATATFTGAVYASAIQELGKRLDLDARRQTQPNQAGETDTPTPEPAQVPDAHVPESPVASQGAESGVPVGSRSVHPDALHSVLVLTPVRDAERFLPRYLELLRQLDYPREKLSLGILEGDSSDQSHAWLEAHRSEFEARVGRFTLCQRHRGNAVARSQRHIAEDQYVRRRNIAVCRNELFRQAYRGEDYVLWIDADLVDYPPDVLHRLLELGRDLVVPHCVLDPGGPTFDLNSFARSPFDRRPVWSHVNQTIIQPPRGEGRRYLEDFRGESVVPLDAVGGTMLLARAQPFADGTLFFPPYSYRGYIETEGLAVMAHDRGFSAWGVPDLEVIHSRD